MENLLVPDLIASTDFDFIEIIEDVKFGDRNFLNAVDTDGILQAEEVEPAAARGLPVVAPNSPPVVRSASPISLHCSVGNGPLPTRVLYALTTPTIELTEVGGTPSPVQAPPLVGLDDVTNGYVPKSTSSKAPCAPSAKNIFSLF